MGSFTVGAVVTVPFPYTDQSDSKRRPAVVLAITNCNDCILCAITSSSRWAEDCVSIMEEDLIDKRLRNQESFAIPSKLLTANKSIIRVVDRLSNGKIAEILEATRSLF